MTAQVGNGQGAEDESALLKLSVGELKKRLFWAGASLPSGHLEKPDLVAAVRKAQEAAAEAQQQAKQQKEKAAQKASAPAAPRETRELDYDATKVCTADIREVVDLHVLSEEELRKRIQAAGGDPPPANAAKFFLVTLLKNTLRYAATEEGKRAQAAKEAAAARAREANNGSSGETFTQEELDRDPSELSAAELKRRLRAYDKALLVGLSEKSEFVTALREAIRTRGQLPTAAPQAAQEIAMTDDEVFAQMAEMQAQMDADAAKAAAADFAAAPVPKPPPEPPAKQGASKKVDVGEALRAQREAEEAAKAEKRRERDREKIKEAAMRYADAARQKAAKNTPPPPPPPSQPPPPEVPPEAAPAVPTSHVVPDLAQETSKVGAVIAAPPSRALPELAQEASKVETVIAASPSHVASATAPQASKGTTQRKRRRTTEVVLSDGEDEVCAVVAEPIALSEGEEENAKKGKRGSSEVVLEIDGDGPRKRRARNAPDRVAAAVIASSGAQSTNVDAQRQADGASKTADVGREPDGKGSVGQNAAVSGGTWV